MIRTPARVRDVTLFQALALVPPVVAGAWSAPAEALVFLAAALTALLWEVVFAGVRKHPFTAHGLTTALIFAVFCPPDVALWQVAVAVSLGVLFGELIFGGRGFGFVSPAALSLALLIVAFPDVALRAPTPLIAVLVLPGLALLLIAGLVSGAVLVAVGLGVAALLAITGQAIEPVVLATALSLGAVYMIADPTAASATPLGRWVYGILAGALVAIFSPGGILSQEAVVAAALLASVFAPLIDHGAVLLHVRIRRTHHHG